MTTIELTQHPELSDLAAELRQGHPVVLTDHGQPMAEIIPARPQRAVWAARLRSLHASFTSPAYAGNSVVDDRQGSR
jgi:antitoxin (DNA-binding transcriptional repressor) of toxin-antitoxin stability system